MISFESDSLFITGVMVPGPDCVVDVKDLDTRKALSWGEMAKTGLGFKVPLCSDVCTLTTPVLPPLVVTRMDCESLMHTVLSSCLASGLVVDLFGTTFGSVFLGTVDPPVVFGKVLKLGKTAAQGVLTSLVSFSGATCWTGTLFSGTVLVVLGTDTEVRSGDC